MTTLTYTTAESEAIKRAWYNATTFYQHRTLGGSHRLDELVKQERAGSQSSGGRWALAECRLYILREWRDGVRNGNTPIEPAQLCSMRPTLQGAWLAGAEAAVRYAGAAETVLASICELIDKAAAYHEAAMSRWRDRNNAP